MLGLAAVRGRLGLLLDEPDQPVGDPVLEVGGRDRELEDDPVRFDLGRPDERERREPEPLGDRAAELDLEADDRDLAKADPVPAEQGRRSAF